MNARTMFAIIFMLGLLGLGGRVFNESAKLHTNYHAPSTSTTVCGKGR